MNEERASIVYISGNNGCGKSTLGQSIAPLIGYTHLPEDRFDTSYLFDQFAAPDRWSFEAQTHFFMFKISQVINALDNHTRVIIDRSPYEDGEIFARYYFETNKMNSRAYATYQQLYRQLIKSLPTPDLILYCDCPVTDLMGRIKHKDREYERLFHENQIQHLDRLYREWLAVTSRRMPGKVYEIRTSDEAFRKPAWNFLEVAGDLCHLLGCALAPPHPLATAKIDDSLEQSHEYGFKGTITPYVRALCNEPGEGGQGPLSKD